GRVIEHGGTTYGYTSAVRFDPDRRVGVIVLTNHTHQGGLANPLSKYAMDLLQGRDPLDYVAVVEEQASQKSARADPAEPLARALTSYAGAYEHPVLGRIE